VAAAPGDNIDLRCPWQKHGEAVAGASGEIRFKCRECARKRGGGVVIIHHFDLATGDYTTRTYRDVSEYLAQRRRERESAKGA
jgi:hypothetical protein